jgi:hypothetical protein
MRDFGTEFGFDFDYMGRNSKSQNSAAARCNFASHAQNQTAK